MGRRKRQRNGMIVDASAPLTLENTSTMDLLNGQFDLAGKQPTDDESFLVTDENFLVFEDALPSMDVVTSNMDVVTSNMDVVTANMDVITPSMDSATTDTTWPDTEHYQQPIEDEEQEEVSFKSSDVTPTNIRETNEDAYERCRFPFVFNENFRYRPTRVSYKYAADYTLSGFNLQREPLATFGKWGRVPTVVRGEGVGTKIVGTKTTKVSRKRLCLSILFIGLISSAILSYVYISKNGATFPALSDVTINDVTINDIFNGKAFSLFYGGGSNDDSSSSQSASTKKFETNDSSNSLSEDTNSKINIEVESELK